MATPKMTKRVQPRPAAPAPVAEVEVQEPIQMMEWADPWNPLQAFEDKNGSLTIDFDSFKAGNVIPFESSKGHKMVTVESAEDDGRFYCFMAGTFTAFAEDNDDQDLVIVETDKDGKKTWGLDPDIAFSRKNGKIKV